MNKAQKIEWIGDQLGILTERTERLTEKLRIHRGLLENRKIERTEILNEIRRIEIKAIEKEIMELKDNLNAKHDEWMEKLCEHRENGGTLSHTTTYMLRNWQ